MQFKKILVIMLMLLPIEAFAIYDILSIDIKPTADDVQFCFDPDYASKYGNTYIAALIGNEITFVSQNPDGSPELSPWQFGAAEPPFFAQRKADASCLGPFPKTVMEGIQVYAGVGTSVDTMVADTQYASIFAGNFPSLPQPSKQWTVMVYMVGSDLEESRGHYGSTDILEMLQGTSHDTSDAVNVVVTTGGARRFGWETMKRSLIQNGQQHVLEELSDTDITNSQTLSDFVLWGTANFPAQHYALILWGHGGGTGGFGSNTTTKNVLKLMDLQQAYQTIHEKTGKLDIVVYDACLMAAIEIAEITATVADAMAASVELEPGHGIDYAHLLHNIDESHPANGIDFGNIVKTGYIQHTKDKDTFDSSQITYSVFDLTQLSLFTEKFNVFADEFNELLKDKSFLNYQTLSRGIIRAPGYPLRIAGQLKSLRSDNNNHIRVDLYNLLQTLVARFEEFNDSAQVLLDSLDDVIVDYATNAKVQNIHSDAGRISLDINITNTGHLAVLPEAYTLFNKGLVYYDERRQEDGFIPDGPKNCFKGMNCFFAQWLELVASDILGIEAYFGQKSGDTSIAYLVDNSFYQYQADLTEDLHLSVDGGEACQYQLCVDATTCEDITLTKQGEQLLADVELNESPAVLSFCNSDKWSICGVAQQIGGIWGRDDVLYPGDEVVPYTLHIPISLDNLLVPASQIESRQGEILTVAVPDDVILQKSCDEKKAAIWAVYYGLNKRGQTELLCDNGDCFCKKPSDDDLACKEIGFKAGVSLTE